MIIFDNKNEIDFEDYINFIKGTLSMIEKILNDERLYYTLRNDMQNGEGMEHEVNHCYNLLDTMKYKIDTIKEKD